MALLLGPAGASAASPVLEFVVPGHSLPVSFTTESGAVTAEMAGFASIVHCAASRGEGEITGPRSAVAKYTFTGCVTERGSNTNCKSVGANEKEIKTGKIDAELVYIDQARHKVGILLDPNGGTYIAFECGNESAEGRGPFLAPVSPVNTEATTFTATLSQSGSAQTPDEYETLTGERFPAIPMGKHGANPLVTTGVAATFTIHSSWPGEIEAFTAEEVQAKEEIKQLQATLKKQEEALQKAEEHAKQVGEEAKKHEQELNAQIAAIKTHQEEEAATNKKRQEEEAAKKKREESKPPTRAQLLSKALTQCKKEPKNKRAQCIAEATKKYGHKAKKKTGKK